MSFVLSDDAVGQTQGGILDHLNPLPEGCILLLLFKNIHLFGCPGSSLWHVESLAVACGIFSRGMWESSSLTRD